MGMTSCLVSCEIVNHHHSPTQTVVHSHTALLTVILLLLVLHMKGVKSISTTRIKGVNKTFPPVHCVPQNHAYPHAEFEVCTLYVCSTVVSSLFTMYMYENTENYSMFMLS